MSSAERIEDFVREIAGLEGEEAFLEHYPHPFLIQEATQVPGLPSQVGGRDLGERATTRVKKVVAPVGGGFMSGNLQVYRVCPADPERGEGAVRLGRREDCDIVVADGSISQEHAHFTLEFDEDDEVSFLVADAGSSNGTFLNGEALPAQRPTRLSDQDSLRFGPALKFQFFTAGGFFQFLSFFRRIKKAGP